MTSFCSFPSAYRSSIMTTKAPKRDPYVEAPMIMTNKLTAFSILVSGVMSPNPIDVIVQVAQKTLSIYSS
jgi:hypothetical protein